ncbi:hypothetical protein [Candidatus Chloroploca sp. Khr17]|uniref:hypothetical protein n=1 Tax=Candidatus Chloroploca sp. Khr17 TaxID=2496869 RepID=UPI00101C5DED|nr:hypothetical protein [Candidatus Chloroploca sp. Khr17]
MRQTWLLLLLGLGVCWLLLASSAQAQGGLTATPTRISAAGVTGERLTRTTVIRATTPITGLQGLATDLISDQGQAIPAPQITIQTSATQVAAGQVLTVTTTFDLERIASGAYQGELLLTSANDVLSLPVTVQVKHPWGWALAVLLLGIAGGGVLTYYRQQVRPYDDILIRAGRLRSQLRNDPELLPSFRQQIERQLIDVEAALQGADIEQARNFISKAEAIWQRWRRDRTNWQAQATFIAELEQRIASASMPTDTAYIRTVQQHLKDATRDAPLGTQEPDAVAGRLKEQQEAVADYQAMFEQIDSLLTQSRHDPSLQQRLRALETRLFNLDPSDAANRSLLQTELANLATEVIPPAPEPDATEAPFVLGGGRGVQPGIFTMPTMPSVVPVTTSEAQVQHASGRRIGELWLSSGFLLVLLALVGLGQLYGNNATFGANLWTDYATLLAWGFGIEASRSAITGLGGK